MGEVEITAGLPGDPRLLSKLHFDHVVGLLAELTADEARVTAGLDIGDQPDRAGLGLEDVVAGDVGVLRVERVLQVLQAETPLPTVDVQLDGGVERGPAVVGGQPGRQQAVRPRPGNCGQNLS